MLGYVAEYKLRKMYFSDPCFKNVHKSDDHDRKKKGDLTVSKLSQFFRLPGLMPPAGIGIFCHVRYDHRTS
jgi:hypothetical protein